MNFDPNKPISNPMLCGAIELMRADDTPEHRRMFLDEMLKANFLSPAVITPPLQPDENGRARLTPESKVQFPMLTNPEGKQLFMAFTDWEELKKWSKGEKHPTLIMTFDDFAGMLLGKDKAGNMNPALGFVINPYSSNIIINKELIAQIVATKMAQSGKPMRPQN